MQKINKVAIIGVGLMGGSLALALRKHYPQAEVWGFARNLDSQKKLKQLKLLDRVSNDLKSLISDADLVVLAVPVYVIIDFFKKIKPYLKPQALVLDLGSSKAAIERKAQQYLANPQNFVGCHPLCGSDKSGAAASRDDLYRDAICIITAKKSNPAARTVAAIWKKLGAKIVFVSAAYHDRVLSLVSHLPHLVSFALTKTVPVSCRQFVPQSLKDLTRISNSAPLVWADIFLSNKKNLLKDLKQYQKNLAQLAQLIKKGNKDKLFDFIAQVNAKQKILIR